MPRGGSPDRQPVATCVARIIDLEAEIMRDVTALTELKGEVDALIRGKCTADLQTLLELRYICLWPWARVAAKLELSEARVYQLHKSALQQLDTY
jgi:DNA-directed RNA polymerase specialized sigma subunit